MQSSELTIVGRGAASGRAIASATFRVLAKDDLDVDAALASALGCLPTDEVAAAAPATALSPEGPCCTRLRRCPDCPTGAARDSTVGFGTMAASHQDHPRRLRMDGCSF